MYDDIIEMFNNTYKKQLYINWVFSLSLFLYKYYIFYFVNTN